MNPTTNNRPATLPASPPQVIEQSDDSVAECIRRIQSVLVKLEADGESDSCRPHDRNSTLVTNWIQQPESAERYFGLLLELIRELRSAPLAALYPFREGAASYETEFSRRKVGTNGRTNGLAIYVHTGTNDNAEMAELVGLLIRYRMEDAARHLNDTAMRSIREARQVPPQVPPQVGRPRIEVAAAAPVSPPVARKPSYPRTPQQPNEVKAS
jgi:hypothetical protein